MIVDIQKVQKVNKNCFTSLEQPQYSFKCQGQISHNKIMEIFASITQKLVLKVKATTLFKGQTETNSFKKYPIIQPAEKLIINKKK